MTARENQLLLQRAAREMAERSALGAIIVPLCFVLAVSTSGYFFHSPYICTLLALILFSSAAVRRLAIKRIKSSAADLLSKWVQVFFWSCLGMAAVWGTITAIFTYTYTVGFPVLLILILSAGIGAGAMINFCIWRPLAVNYLLLSFAPTVLTGLLIQQTELLPTIAALVFFVVYLLAQTKYWNFHFWDSLITAYLFERQAEKLSDVNYKLAETIEKEQKLRREVEKSKAKVLDLFNLTHDAIVICALDGRVLDFNLSALEMFSGERDEILNSSFLQFINISDDSTMNVKDHWQKVAGGLEDDFECAVTRPGRRELLHALVNMRRLTWQEDEIIFVTLRDITAEKQVEETLRITKKFLSESEGYLQAILRNIELPIYCKDLEGCYLTVNTPFETLCCLGLDQLRGRNDMDVFPENVARFFSFKDFEIIRTGESIELEGIFTFDGQEKNLLVHKFPLKESSGAIYATAGICTDVTIMKKALHTAQLANEAKSEFLASMSHEIRTPMHSILSVARLGLKRVSCSSREKLETYFKMIVTSGDQLLELLSELLDLSTLESAKACYNLAEYDLSKDLEKVTAELKVMMDEKEIALSLETMWYPAPARYDRTKLYQVLRNLLANAMKFSAPKKEVKILLKKDYLEKENVRWPAWKVLIVDQGIGVEKDELESVFDKFVRGSKTSKEISGVGLGLSICKRIIEDHQGIIWAEQNEPEGTIFCFLLPALD
jgi:PAS domain S-box-containing protein